MVLVTRDHAGVEYRHEVYVTDTEIYVPCVVIGHTVRDVFLMSKAKYIEMPPPQPAIFKTGQRVNFMHQSHRDFYESTL
jgi:hypothetical protein